jgi:hypothetical protein
MPPTITTERCVETHKLDISNVTAGGVSNLDSTPSQNSTLPLATNSPDVG